MILSKCLGGMLNESQKLESDLMRNVEIISMPGIINPPTDKETSLYIMDEK